MRTREATKSVLRRWTAALAAAALIGAGIGAAGPASADPAPAPFTFLVLPDTQNYVSTGANAPIMGQQTAWVASHKDQLNIAFVAQLGDLVGVDSSTVQWQRASQYMATLDSAGVPNTVLPGNHDMVIGTGDLTFYNQYFPVSRYAGASWSSPSARYTGYLGQSQFGPDPIDRQNGDSYALFTAGGMDFLLLNLEYTPSDAAVAWAQRVLAAYPDRRAILATHSYLTTTGAFSNQVLRGDGGNDGLQLWSKLVAPSCSIFLVVSGHHHDGDLGEARRTDTNSCGKPVYQIMSDYQERANGGNGWLRYYTFDPAADTITAVTYSPSLDRYETDADSAFVLPYAMAGVPGEPDPRLAADDFARTSSAGWGIATVGGPWAVAGAAARYPVGGGVGRQTVNAGATLTSTLGDVRSTSTDLQVTLSLDRIPDSAVYLTTFARWIGSSGYGARIKVLPGGAVQLHAARADAVLAGNTVPGLTLTSGARLHVRTQVEGTGPTTIRVRAWLDGASEPTTWAFTATDSTPGLQAAGGIRLQTYCGAAVTASYDDVSAVGVGGTVPPPANQPPVAAFTATTDWLAARVDASASTDPDGTVVARDWAFGDGSSGTGVTANHTYATAGTYIVTLTVRDDDGATASTTHSVAVSAPPENQPPVAAFTLTTDGLTARADATASSDPDGTVVARDWTFGDGSTGSGATASHAYAAAGTYVVMLTVRDDDGASATTTRSVTVSLPPPATALAEDPFGRTVTGGWGVADLGGTWVVSGGATRFSVASGTGRTAPAPGGTVGAALPAVSSTSTDLHVSTAPSVDPGGRLDLTISGRVVGAADYGAVLKLYPDGSVQLYATRTGTTMVGGVVPGLRWSASVPMHVRVQVTGTSPTVVRARTWREGTAEPSTWSASASDSTAALQAAGGIKLSAYLSSAAAAPVTVLWDDLTASRVP